MSVHRTPSRFFAQSTASQRRPRSCLTVEQSRIPTRKTACRFAAVVGLPQSKRGRAGRFALNRQLIPNQPMCPDRAFARQMIGAFEAFRRAKRNGRDPLPEVIGYWNGETQPVTQKDIEHESSYGDLSRVFPFLKQRNAKPINDESQP